MMSNHPIRTVATMFFASAFLLALFAGPAVAGTREAPEIEDGAGDVPVAVKVEGAPAFAGLFDIDKAYVAAEDKDGFTFRFYVEDIPDDWSIDDPTPPSGRILPVSGSPAIPSDDELFRNGVHLTLFFKVAGKEYTALASLAAIDVQNPNALPKVDTREVTKAALEQAVFALTKAADTSKALASTSLRTALDDNFDDAQGFIADAYRLADAECQTLPDGQDVCTTQTLKDQLCPDASTGPEGGTELSLGDEHGFICPATGEDAGLICLLAPETAMPTRRPCAPSTLLQGLALGALDEAATALEAAQALLNDNVAVPGPLGAAVETQAILAGQLATVQEHLVFASEALDDSAWFSIGDAALPSAPPPASAPARPEVILYHKFDLHQGTNASTPTSGAIDAKEDFVQVRILKSAVGNPAAGSALSSFRAESSFNRKPMDYAPDLDLAKADPVALVDDPHMPIGAYTYGKDYVFSYTASVAAPPMPGSVQIQWTALDENPKAIDVNGVATYRLSLRSHANAALAGILTLSPDGGGWHAELDQTSFQLAPGEARTITVRVMALQGASPVHTTQVDASVDGGETRTSSFTTSLKSAATAPGTGPGNNGGSKSILGMSHSVAVVAGMALGALLIVGVGAAGIYFVRRR